MGNSRKEQMDKIFNQLSEFNQDIIILLGKSMKISQEVNKQPIKHQSIWKQKQQS